MFAVRKLLIPMLILTALPGGESQAAQGIKIEKVGMGTQVSVTRSGATVKLKEGDPLQGGDELTTDAQTAVDLRLEDESLIRVGVNSVYRIEESSKFLSLVHRLLTGVVRIQVPKNENKNAEIKFRMYTPEGTIGVRGTEFVVIRTAEGTELKGLSGEVMFGGKDADYGQAEKFVMVTKGFHSMVKANGAGASKPEKFNLDDYRKLINGRSGAFAPLALRPQPPRTYGRNGGNNTGASQPVAQASASKPQPTTGGNVGGGTKNDPDRYKNWQNILYKGVIHSKVSDVELAISKGADVNHYDKEIGLTPLQIAVQEAKDKDKDILIVLLANGAKVNQKNSEGLTPLMYVAREKLDLEYAKVLVNPGGAKLDEKDKAGNTALDWAIDSGYKELADYLKSEDAQNDYEAALDEKAAAEKKKKK